MAGKRTQSGKALKPKKVKGKPAVKKPVKTKTQVEKQIALKEAKMRLRALKSALKEIKVQVKAERGLGAPDPDALRADISRMQSQVEKVQLDLEQAKALSRKRKDEIDEWKAWYEKLPDEEKSAGLANLNNEIDWRAAELDANGQKINELMMAEIEAMGALETTLQKLAAVEAGAYKLPMEKDPRLKGVLAEIEKATEEVARLSPKKK